jgi:hypothetical protein
LGLIFFCKYDELVVSVLQLYKSSDSVRVRLLSANVKSGLWWWGIAAGVMIHCGAPGNATLLFTATEELAGVPEKGRFSWSFDVMESSMKTLLFRWRWRVTDLYRLLDERGY